MDFIDNQKVMFDDLIDIYSDDHFLNKIEFKRDQIISVFEQIFADEAENFKLVYNNSIQNGKYYKIESRIKKADSLREKFYRRNIGLELIRDLSLTRDNIHNKGKIHLIKERYSLLDDIIGIRIITELKADCLSALSLIENRVSLFNQSGIFFQTDFKTQPSIMDNGLEIIKLKGIYGGKNAFELQIKSKIDSAWGDIDHKLFYKDYNSTLLKDNLQVSMNNIGELLNHIEKFLFDLRETNNNTDDDYQNQRLVVFLFDKISPAIDEKLKIKYDLKRILEPVLFFSKVLNIGDSTDELDFNYFEEVKDFSGFAGYEAIRKFNFDYVLLEIIFINFLLYVESNEGEAIDYNSLIKYYFVVMSKYMEKKINESDINLEKNYYKVIFRKILLLLSYVEDPNILFDFTTYKKLRLIDKIIIDVIAEDELDLQSKDVSELCTIFSFTNGKIIAEYEYDEDEDYIDLLTKVKKQVEAMEDVELLNFFNRVILNIAKDIESKEEM